MKTWMASMALGLALFAGSTAHAGDGQVPQDTLAGFGLGGMQTMTDAQGMEVRGKFAAVYGTNTASLLGSTASNSYKAVGKHEAFGDSYSQVDLKAKIYIHHVPVVKVHVSASAWGNAYAWAH